MEIIQLICNGIILISAVIIATKNIAEMLGKPIKLVKKKSDIEFKYKVLAILNEILPKRFEEHDLETRERYLADRQAYLEEIKKAVIKEIRGELMQVQDLTKQYQALEISAKDVLREKIVCLYENNKDRRCLRYFERQALKQYYKDYKAMNGNSYIDLIYSRMETWDTEDDDYQ